MNASLKITLKRGDFQKKRVISDNSDQFTLEIKENKKKSQYPLEPGSAFSTGITLIKYAFLSELRNGPASGKTNDNLYNLVVRVTNEIMGDETFCRDIEEQLETSRPKCESGSGELNGGSYPSQECLKRKCFVCSKEFVMVRNLFDRPLPSESWQYIPRGVYHCFPNNSDEGREACSERCYRSHQKELCLHHLKTRKILSCTCHDVWKCKDCSGNCLVCHRPLGTSLSEVPSTCVLSELGICSNTCAKMHCKTCVGCRQCAE